MSVIARKYSINVAQGGDNADVGFDLSNKELSAYIDYFNRIIPNYRGTDEPVDADGNSLVVVGILWADTGTDRMRMCTALGTPNSWIDLFVLSTGAWCVSASVMAAIIKLGSGTVGIKGIQADNGSENLPMIRYNETTQTISTLTRSTTMATLTTDGGHGLSTGDIVTVSGVTPSGFNGTYAITYASAVSFTYVMLADPGGDASVVGAYSAIRRWEFSNDGLTWRVMGADIHAVTLSADKPVISYNSTSAKWEYSNDGTVFFEVGSGAGGGNYFGDESDGAKTFSADTFLGHSRITNYALSSNVLTITTEHAHGLTTNDWVSIAQCSEVHANTTNAIGTYGTTAGTHYLVVTGTPTDTTFTVAKTHADIISTAETNADATVCKWDGPAIIKNYTTLSVVTGNTVTPAARCKGLLIYATGAVNIAGTITMTARGASGTGDDNTVSVFAPHPMDANLIPLVSYSIPAVGATGGAGRAGGAGVGTTGTAGTNGQTGGGGSGGGNGVGATGTGAGGTGTSYSGGAGSGNSVTTTSSAGSSSGGAGSAGGGTDYSVGGAGNPGGAGAGANGFTGNNGTGGLIILICQSNFTISGTISAQGIASTTSQTTASSGGGSGGGSINVFYGGTLSNSGTLSAAGGVASGYLSRGAAGGAGTTRLVKVVA